MSFGLSRGKQLDTTGFGIEGAALPPYDPANPKSLDPRTWFEHPSRPLEIEIGSGKGTFLVQQAALQPQINFLGIEWASEFYRFAADRLRRRNVTNVKMLHADATEFIRYWCADEVAQVVHLYFSDPWPKKRHHKRRVVQEHSLMEFHRVLVPCGELRLVTDHDELWSWYEEHASRQTIVTLFERIPFDPPKSAGEDELVGTNFERKYAREGRPFRAMTLVKKEQSDS